MGNYRSKFIKAYPGIRVNGQPGWWYRCMSCGRWCARPDSYIIRVFRRNIIPFEMRMEVDHIKPWSLGGTDDLSNLQPLCLPCNRAKGNQMDAQDAQIAYTNDMAHGRAPKFIKRRKKRNQCASQRF